ncbi:PREDICTED: ubiquitin-conjugating enzyme E2 J2-like [Acropora digitifera]|uniref:ubiquitin-conjugating enzyme E2 J2-like n=1 Tax=Acropora digitifera TaxID=70779 RepID=UPI00077A6FBE|nr:PREDICTED: ubiquitin-conjugating enzyme E2 J2-like [Acropora digitifera]
MAYQKRVHTTAASRLRQDYLRIVKDPVPYITALPLPSNILEWHYVVRGPENTPYSEGYYHGKLVFPKDFPFKPPRIFMTTPNGRFKVNTRLCLSISDFHPDTWNPAWSVSTILTGLLSFMVETSGIFLRVHYCHPVVSSVEIPLPEETNVAAEVTVHTLECHVYPHAT